MILEWHSEFDGAQMLWLTASAVAVLLLLLPGCAALLTGGGFPFSGQVRGEQWLIGGALHVAVWITVLHSLAFGPSLGTTPVTVDTRPPQGLEQMIREAGQVMDQRPFWGRGGFIGDLGFAGFRHLQPEGNSEAPMYAARRPHGRITLATFITFQLSVYLCSVGAVMAVVVAGRRAVSSIRLGVFSLLWGLVVYAPVAHWVWGEGWLGIRYAVDAGGSLLILMIGVAAMVVVGRGHSAAVHSIPPWWNSSLLATVGALLFWLSFPILMASLRVPTPELRSLILLNSLAAGSGGFLFCGLLKLLAPTAGGIQLAAHGLCAGLAAVAAGSVMYDPLTSMICGAAGAAAGWIVWTAFSRYLGWTDGAATVMLVAAAFTGMLSAGVFGNSANGVRHWDGSTIDGLLYDNPSLLVAQLLAAVCVLVWTAVCTWGLMQICVGRGSSV
jgi:ammonia channel protein AmtB